jgi:hypothetical protein
MKIFIRNNIFFAITCLLLFVIAFKVIAFFLNNDRYFVLDKNKAAIVIGHSHAGAGINPEYAPDLTNLCTPGESYYFSYIKMRQILKSNKHLKLVLLEYSNNQITTETKKWIFSENFLGEHYPRYAGFINWDEKAYLLFKHSENFLPREAASLKKELIFLLNKKQDKNYMTLNGWGHYIRLDVNKTDSLIEASNLEKPETVDSTLTDNIDYLKKITELCRTEGITLVLIRSPLHPRYHIEATEHEFHRILNTELKDVPFVDFKNYPISDSEFADLHHLNYKGAIKYSKAIDSLIKRTFQLTSRGI